MSEKVITVSLRHGGKEIKSLSLEPGMEDILIGRDETCALRIPSGDRTVSHEHARIYFQKGAFWLADNNSCNGVIKDRKKITKPVKLKDHDIYYLGKGVLLVSVDKGAVRVAQPGAKRRHVLRFLNGPRKGEDVEIRPSEDSTGAVFTVGLDPANDLVLSNKSVSRRHASFRINLAGECYVKDLGSRNGTFVGDKKMSGQESFLKIGERIRIASYSFVYHNGSLPPPFPWKMVLILLTLGLVGFGAWKAVEMNGPSADNWLEVAERLARADNFPAASNAVLQAYDAHGITSSRLRIDDFKGRLFGWMDDRRQWDEVLAKLKAGRHGGVRQDLNRLKNNASGWTWNDTTAKDMQKDVVFAEEFIMLIYNAAAVIRADSIGKEPIEKTAADIDKYLADHKKDLARRPYLDSALKNLMRIRKTMGEIIDQTKELDGIFLTEHQEKPKADCGSIGALSAAVGVSFKDKISKIDALCGKTNLCESVRRKAELLLPICRDFVKTEEALDKELSCIHAMDFVGLVRLKDLPLPNNDNCALYPFFSDARDRFVSLHDAYQKIGGTLVPMLNGLTESGVTCEGPGELLTRICDGKVWKAALDFDCFRRPFPMASREFAGSVYDELFGIKTVYEGLRNLPKEPDRLQRAERNFLPKTIVSAMVFNQVKSLLVVLEREDAKPYRAGKLGEFYSLARRVMEMREELVVLLRAEQSKGDGSGTAMNRRQVVAGYYVEFFAESGEASYANLRGLESAFRAIERKVMTLDEERKRESDPEKRIKLRDEILSVGFPGNGAVREAWIDKVNAGGE